MRLKYFFTIQISLCQLVGFSYSYAATINAASCSQADVEAAITVANTGDTISVPTCTGVASATWPTSISVAKSITIQGQTTGCPDACIDGTVIKEHGFSVSTDNVKIKGFTLDNNNAGGYAIVLTNARNFVFGKSKVTGKWSNWLKVPTSNTAGRYCAGGVIYDTLIIDVAGEGIDYNGPGATSWSQGGHPESWPECTLFFEDNIFKATGAQPVNIADGNDGDRRVFRYNHFEDSKTYNWGILLENHGNPTTIPDYQSYSLAVYNNTMTANHTANNIEFLKIRAGQSVIYNNTITYGTGNVDACIHLLRDPDAACNGAEDYPCKHQINNTYTWANTKGSGDCTIWNASSFILDDNRDYWTDTTGSNFSTGVAASRPGTCTDDDVYWETDSLDLFRCDGTNNWILVYEQYPYPHPLTHAIKIPEWE